MKERFIKLLQNKNLLLYLFFVAVATIFWFLYSLGKEYSANVNVDVTYYNFPIDKEPRQTATQKLTLNVTAYGFSLMRMQLKSAFHNYKIDLSKLKKQESSKGDSLHYDLTVSAIRNQFEGQLGVGISINSVFPEDVEFSVLSMRVKKLPIISRLKVGLKSGYMIVDEPKLEPDSVVVRGHFEAVDTMTFVPTESTFVDNISSSFEKKVSLEAPSPQIELNGEYTRLSYRVSEYIDEQKVLKVLAVNFPDSVIVTLHPAEVALKYRTYAAAKEFIKEEDFTLIIDYNTISSFSQKLEVKAIGLPKGISKVTMNPRYINYIITHKK